MNTLSPRQLPLILLAIVASPFLAYAQQKCGTMVYNEKLEKVQIDNHNNNNLDDNFLFDKEPPVEGDNSESCVIPVVFHIIHNGEREGINSNIPYKNILSQIRVLNEDFQRKNADASQTIDKFKSVAGTMNIEFVLAKQDPNGKATNGVVRINGRQTSWTDADDMKLKKLSNWPQTDYVNIWVVNLDLYKGYARIPQADIGGLRNILEPTASDDGIVLDYDAVGSIDDGISNLDVAANKGRVLTHEMGHFLGLFHIWGRVEPDEMICSTDYVDDTPFQKGANSNCNMTLPEECIEGTGVMYQNYMDYSNDICVNLFSKDQVERMDFVLRNSLVRKLLLRSKGAIEPPVIAYDIGIDNINMPSTICAGVLVTPSITLRNYGTRIITEPLTVHLSINNVVVKEKKTFFVEGGLTSSKTSTLSYDPVSLTEEYNTIEFLIDANDNNPSNNSAAINVKVKSEIINAPFSVALDDIPSGWETQSINDVRFKWTINAPNNHENNNAVLLLNKQTTALEPKIAYNRLTTPIIKMDEWIGDNIVLRFSWAYNGDLLSPRYNTDSLRIAITENCNTELFTEVIHKQASNSLFTSNRRNQYYFVPKNIDEWQTKEIPLPNFRSYNNPQIVLIGSNNNRDFGGNLYIDDITITRQRSKDAAPYHAYILPSTEDVIIDINMPSRGDILAQIYDVKGNMVIRQWMPDVYINRKTISMRNHSAGMYIVYLQSKDDVTSTKLFINP